MALCMVRSLTSRLFASHEYFALRFILRALKTFSTTCDGNSGMLNFVCFFLAVFLYVFFDGFLLENAVFVLFSLFSVK